MRGNSWVVQLKVAKVANHSGYEQDNLAREVMKIKTFLAQTKSTLVLFSRSNLLNRENKKEESEQREITRDDVEKIKSTMFRENEVT